MTWLPFLVGLVADLVSGWMIVTLPDSGSLAAGWRHELICSVLAALAIFAATWSQGRPWPQPAAAFAGVQVLGVTALLVLPGERLVVLAVAAVVIAAASSVVLPFELRASRGAPPPLVGVVLLGLLDLVAVTPTFFFLAAQGTLR